MAFWLPPKKNWAEYPLGSCAKTLEGAGHWIKEEKGWRWCTGKDYFPTPGNAALVRVPRQSTP